MNQLQAGLIHLYVGDGKGKTTAAAGLALRALGCGRRVLFCQFLKGGKTGEIAPLQQLGATVLRAKHSRKFTFQMTGEELEQAGLLHRQCLAQAAAYMRDSEYGLVVLDEIVDAVNCGLLPLESVAGLVRSRPASVEMVLTGRNPDPALVSLADYHTDFVCRKHPFQQGVGAREGIEY